MAIKPSNSASISVPFTEQADAINKIIQQVQGLSTAVRAAAQDFSSIFAVMDRAGPAGGGFQTSTGAGMGSALSMDAQQASQAQAMNAMVQKQAKMYGWGGADPIAFSPVSKTGGLELAAASIGRAGASEQSQQAALANMNNFAVSGSMPTGPSVPWAARNNFNFADYGQRQHGEAMAAITGNRSLGLGMSDVYKSMNTDTSSLIAQSQSNIERLGSGSAVDKEVAVGMRELVSSIAKLNVKMEENSRALETATGDKKTQAQIALTQAAAAKMQAEQELAQQNANVGGGPPGKPPSWGDRIMGQASWGGAAAIAAAGFQAASFVQGTRAGIAGESIGAGTGAVLAGAQSQGVYERRVLRSLDMTNAQNLLEFQGDLLLGDARLGDTGRNDSFARGTRDAIMTMEQSRLSKSSSNLGGVAKLIGGVAAIGAGVGGLVGSVGLSGPMSAMAIGTGASLIGSALTSSTEANRSLFEQVRMGGNAGSVMGDILSSSKIDQNRAASDITAAATASIGLGINQSGDIPGQVAANSIFSGMALERMQTMSSQYRSGFATAGRYNPSELGAYSSLDANLAGKAIGLGISPEELQASQIRLAANTGAGVGASVNDAAAMTLMSRSGAGSVDQLMGNIAGLGGAQGGTSELKTLIPLLENAFSAGFDKSRLAQQFVGASISLASNLGGGAQAASEMLAAGSAGFGGGEYGLRSAARGLEAYGAKTDPLSNPLFWGSNRVRTVLEKFPELRGTGAYNKLISIGTVEAQAALSGARAFVAGGDSSADAIDRIENQDAKDLVRSLGGKGAVTALSAIGQADTRGGSVSVNNAAPAEAAKIAALQAQADAVESSNIPEGEKRKKLAQIGQQLGSVAALAGSTSGLGGAASRNAMTQPFFQKHSVGRPANWAEGLDRGQGSVDPADVNKQWGIYTGTRGTMLAASQSLLSNTVGVQELDKRFQDSNFTLAIASQGSELPTTITAADWTAHKSGTLKGDKEKALSRATMLDLVKGSNESYEKQVEKVSGGAGAGAAGSITNFLGANSAAEFAESFFRAWNKMSPKGEQLGQTGDNRADERSDRKGRN